MIENEGKTEENEKVNNENVSDSTSTPHKYLHKPLTSSNTQHKAISKSKSVAKNKSEAISRVNSKKQVYFHPTDVVTTCVDFSSTDEIINSISSELLIGCFDAEKSESNQNSLNSTQTK